jgi:hypothetical protein
MSALPSPAAALAEAAGEEDVELDPITCEPIAVAVALRPCRHVYDEESWGAYAQFCRTKRQPIRCALCRADTVGYTILKDNIVVDHAAPAVHFPCLDPEPTLNDFITLNGAGHLCVPHTLMRSLDDLIERRSIPDFVIPDFMLRAIEEETRSSNSGVIRSGTMSRNENATDNTNENETESPAHHSVFSPSFRPIPAMFNFHRDTEPTRAWPQFEVVVTRRCPVDEKEDPLEVRRAPLDRKQAENNLSEVIEQKRSRRHKKSKSTQQPLSRSQRREKSRVLRQERNSFRR